MLLEPLISAVVLLAGVDADAAAWLQPAAEVLESFGVETETVALTADGFAATLSHRLRAIIVASPDAALPAALAVRTGLPVIRVPTEAAGRSGLALLHDGHGALPAGPVGGVFATMAIGQAGAKNAALFVVSALAHRDERLRSAWKEFRARQTEAVLQGLPLTLED